MVDDDPLDTPEFDPVEYLNHQFPTERSLDRLEPFMISVAVQIGDLDEEISKTVQAQSEAGHQATKDVDEAKVAIRELFEKIRDMKAKAEQSEVMVQEICRDIKQLDFAKRHLQTTITALKRLHMLVTAVDQLQTVAKAKQYRESANLLDAVRQLLTHFESYAKVCSRRLSAIFHGNKNVHLCSDSSVTAHALLLSAMARFHESRNFERRSQLSRTSWWSRLRKHLIRSGNSRAQQPTRRVFKEMLISLDNSGLCKRLAWLWTRSEARPGNCR